MSASSQYGRGARILSIGIASTGLMTFAYFSVASHVLAATPAKRIDLLWSVMFVVISVIYRPIEQLLSRTIAERSARGQVEQPMRVPVLIQGSFAALFLVLALVFEGPLTRAFEHQHDLYVILVVGTLAYAASYFARGWLAGHQRFGLFGGLVLMESVSRLCFALAVAVGIASGQTAVALGIAAAPFVSLIVVPIAFLRGGGQRQLPPAPITVDEAAAALAGPGTEGVQEAAAHDDLSLRRGGGFAVWVSGIMLSEQTLLNAAVLTVDASSRNPALAGIVFNVLLIARAPLQLFQAIQTSLLPHLTKLATTSGHEAFAHAIRVTIAAIAAFALAVAVVLLVAGPFLMRHVLFGQHHDYPGGGLALIGVGMGLHLTAGALNQSALARDQARAAALCWGGVALLFVGWMVAPLVGDQLLRAEIGYAAATALLASALAILYRRPPARSRPGYAAATAPAIAR